MGCVSSKILAKSGSYQEKGSLGHSFQRSSVIEEIILSSSKSNGDQFLALLCASNSSASRKAKEPEPEQSPAPPPAVAEPAAKIETINVSELLAGLEEENGVVEQSDRKDGDNRSPSPRVSDGAAAAAGRAWSFRTVEEFDALVTQQSGSSPSERAAEREEPRAAAAAAAAAEEATGSGGGGGGASGQGGEAEQAAAGARRRARARQLGELKVPAAAFDFSKSGSLRDWLRQGGQTFSPGSYVTPKFGTAPAAVPAEHGGGGEQQQRQEEEEEHEVFDPELVAQFEHAMEKLSEDEGRVLDEILDAMESEAGEKDDTAAAAFSFGTMSYDRPAAVAAQQV
ncbi:unnamed protein product [Urochloa decumbens]|uniref:Uncharacterized protein n=1 Tax=Urochloa decumbens TaxID=240449 RepID=A0ABC9BQE7_9POAL